MNSLPSNIYEAESNKFTEEKDRLSNFNLPTKASIDVIGAIKAGNTVLDVGAGPNTELLRYVELSGGVFTALDKNADFLETQKSAGANAILADARNIPVNDDCFDVAHERFVISHLGEQKQKAIKEIIRVTRSKGRAIFLEYDWTTAQGSETFNKVKDFMIGGGFLFDADYGATLEKDIRSSMHQGSAKITMLPPTFMTDYSQVIRLRQAGSTDLKMQGKGPAAEEWNEILDELEIEASSINPPGFYFPGIVAATVSKD